jgi:hypothetical protein
MGKMDTALSSSLMGRTVARPRPAWATALLIAAVYLPTLAAAAGMGLQDLLTNPSSRSTLTDATVIAYILVISPFIWRMPGQVVQSLRPVILLDDGELREAVQRASRVSPVHEIAAMAAGLLLGVLLTGGIPPSIDTWPEAIMLAMGYAMLGLVGWLMYISIAATRVVSYLLRLPLHIDPLDITPFEVIGRQSLVIALVFAGGIVISFLLMNFGVADLGDLRFWLLYGPLILLPVVVFFLNMFPTQRVLARARNEELAAVRRELHAAFGLLAQRRGEAPAGSLSPDSAALPAYVAALAAHEQHLNDASPWPYNPRIIRSLVVGVLAPLATVLARRVFEVLIR